MRWKAAMRGRHPGLLLFMMISSDAATVMRKKLFGRQLMQHIDDMTKIAMHLLSCWGPPPFSKLLNLCCFKL